MRKIRDEKGMGRNDRETQQGWSRPSEVVKWCGIRKSRLYQLLVEANGEIKTCVLKSPGATRGARLINLQSLFAYIEALAQAQQKGA